MRLSPVFFEADMFLCPLCRWEVFSLESNLSKALDLVGMLVDRLEGGDSVNGVGERAGEEEWEE